MAKYASMAIAPRAWYSTQHTNEGRPSCDVFESDDAPVKTGLLDATGTPIYRLSEKAPLGFCR